MDIEKNNIKPENLPFELDGIQKKYGIIRWAEEKCQGVYFLCMEPAGDPPVSVELYAVMEESPISQEAWSYGKSFPEQPELRLFECGGWDYHWMAVVYEIMCFRKKRGLPLDDLEDLHTFAAYGMEVCPEYFGTYPVPERTPWGYTTRHKTIHNGVYWIETDQCVSTLAVCYAIHDDLSDTVLALAEYNDYDREQGIGQTLGYFFFPEDTICLPLFELCRRHQSWDCDMVNRAALMNAIWMKYPEYAAAHNLLEQQGGHDGLGLLLRWLGIDAELRSSPENMITLVPEEGTSFLSFLGIEKNQSVGY